MLAFAAFFEKHPRLVGLLVVALLAFFGLGAGKLRFDDEPRGILRSESAEFALLEEVWRDFGADDNDALVVVDGGSIVSPDGVEALTRTIRDLRALDGVAGVSSLADVVTFEGLLPSPLLPKRDALERLDETQRARVEADVLAHPLVGGRLLSDDGETTLLVVNVAPTTVQIEALTPIVDAITKTVERLSAEGPRRVRVTGIPSVRVELYRTARFEQLLFFSLASLLCSCIAWWLFRDWRSVVVAAVPPFFGSIFAGGAFGWLGWKIDLLGTVIPMLVTVIGFTDAVHLTIHARRVISEGGTPLAAAADSIRRVGKACLLTSVTTAIGFGSLALGHLDVIVRFGQMCGLAMLLAFLAVLTGLPVLAALLLRPGKPGGDHIAENFFARLAPWISRYARPIVAVGVALTAALAFVSLRLETENHLLEATPHDSPTFTALRDLETAFGGALPMYVLVEWDAGTSWTDPAVREVVAEVEAILDSEPDAGRAFSILDVIESLPPMAPAAAFALLPEDVTRRLVRPDLRRLLVAALVPDGSRDVMMPLFERVQAQVEAADERHANVRLFVTGTDVVARRHIHAMIRDLATSLGFASLLIFLAISWAFRSFGYGLVSLIPNAFPLVVMGGVIHLSGRSLEISSAVVFSVLLGLAVDDTIHFLSRWKDETEHDHPPLKPTLVHVGKAISWTTLILVAGLAVTLTSSVPTTRWFAVLCIVGMLAAVVGDLVLLPALMVVRRRSR